MRRLIVYFLPPISRPPASLISFTAIRAAFLQEAPTAGISPVNSAFKPIGIVNSALLLHPTSTILMIVSIATNEITSVFFINEFCLLLGKYWILLFLKPQERLTTNIV